MLRASIHWLCFYIKKRYYEVCFQHITNVCHLLEFRGFSIHTPFLSRDIPARVVVHFVLEIVETESAFVDGVEHEGQHGLKARETGRRGLAGLLLHHGSFRHNSYSWFKPVKSTTVLCSTKTPRLKFIKRIHTYTILSLSLSLSLLTHLHTYLECVRRMVRSYTVYELHVVPQGLLVLPANKNWPHLSLGEK